MVQFETIIGLEVHAQLLTESKMFCRCSAGYASADPNTHVCPVCLGLPGALPVINHGAVQATIMTGLALTCSIPEYSKFDRKNYIYPDLMKGYQISQYDLPLCGGGVLPLVIDGKRKDIGITRVHLEEDTARLVHRTANGETYSLVDVNRSGVPLMEIVSEPDMRSPEEARAYLMALRQILRYIGVSTANMEEGAFRCDANVSQRTLDGSVIGPKVEIKNMNSFRSVERALAFEVERQRKALRDGEALVQETRGWVEDQGITVSQRTKEFAHDYRYFPEPDLPPLVLDRAEVDGIQSRMAELPTARRDRFIEQYGLNEREAELLTVEREVADFFEVTVDGDSDRAREASNWITGEIFALMRDSGLELEDVKISPEQIRELIELVGEDTINNRTAKEVLVAVHETGKSPREIVEERGLAQVSDEAQLLAVVRSVVDEHPDAVTDYQNGKKAAIGFLIGQVMRQMRGTANPGVARSLLEQTLAERVTS
ncbi:MAG: Asp-tRNA(Asn)/Glu-tRNA(Gln) amidotransferase subunit GatB [Sphaerobacteraceae bacterium]|nr:MAG: Asp-tRNA(Asn)/Glu-tRNA(Gln) amidotransferase subunit GatB [Sphaerobacteraceae bacterium]